MTRFRDKVVVVTGGAKGIGNATAMAFAREGARVAILDLDSPSDNLFGLKCDVSKEAQVRRAVERTVARFGRLDILYNNAGAFQPDGDRADSLTSAQWHRVLNVNLTGTLLFSKYAVPEMVKAGGGKIVNVASTLGLMASEGFAAYVSSKHGEVGLTKQMALEYGPKNIRVNAICPGPIDTPMLVASGIVGERRRQMEATIPLRRIGTPEDIASAALFFASEDSSFVSGIHLPVDGGGSARA
jgi:NAD(P)-dependent dehydrogenase (short-subunit alcohol dehydrogenase family)